MSKQEWITMTKILVISSLIASVGNWIYNAHYVEGATLVERLGNSIYPWETFIPLGFMVILALVSCRLQIGVEKVFPKVKLPSILYLTMVTLLLSIPGLSPLADFMMNEFAKIELLPLCTPILAYAGISIGKDLDEFKKQGLAIICVALCTFLGTYVGSAIIAQIVLKLQGII